MLLLCNVYYRTVREDTMKEKNLCPLRGFAPCSESCAWWIKPMGHEESMCAMVITTCVAAEVWDILYDKYVDPD